MKLRIKVLIATLSLLVVVLGGMVYILATGAFAASSSSLSMVTANGTVVPEMRVVNGALEYLGEQGEWQTLARLDELYDTYVVSPNEPQPTATPAPSPSPTIEPTQTPEPTAEPTASPTSEPTDTPKPTKKPSSTPKPTATAKPTPTPTPVVTAPPVDVGGGGDTGGDTGGGTDGEDISGEDEGWSGGHE
ncbi:MAG TPA: hypothetical protein PKB13_04045 [Clostridia bacterium]|nr:hypothetical protein [Clostridia bacterium]